MIELKNSKPHLKSQEHMNNQGLVINNYIIIEPELCEINSIAKNNKISYDRKFCRYEMQCKWQLVFDNIVLIDVKSKSQYRWSLNQSLEKISKEWNQSLWETRSKILTYIRNEYHIHSVFKKYDISSLFGQSHAYAWETDK